MTYYNVPVLIAGAFSILFFLNCSLLQETKVLTSPFISCSSLAGLNTNNNFEQFLIGFQKEVERPILKALKEIRLKNTTAIGIRTGCLNQIGKSLYLKIIKEEIEIYLPHIAIHEKKEEESSELSELILILYPVFDTFYSLKSDKDKNTLKTLAELFNLYQETKMEINVHSNFWKTTPFDFQLTENRAHTVAKILVADGLSKERILHHKGFSSQVPIQKPITHPLNQRVEIRILPSQKDSALKDIFNLLNTQKR